MNRILTFLALTFMLWALSISAEAQPMKKVHRIGLLSGARPSPTPTNIEALRQGLRELGYVEGQNILIEYRFAEGKEERYAIMAAELVNLAVDVIVTFGTQATVAAKQATSSIPILVGNAGDLVGEGIVASLARPGGNVTGFTSIDPDLSAKRLQLLRETLPKVSRGAVIYHGGPGGDQEELREIQTAAGSLLSYGANVRDMCRRSATLVDKIIKGRKPADLPLERAHKFEFVVNLKSAKQLGVMIPPNVLARADRIIR